MDRRTFLMLASSLPGLAATHAGYPRATLQIARREFSSIDPYVGNQRMPSAFSWLYDGLTGVPGLGIPGLARSVTMRGTIVEYALREDVRWHDGRRFDVASFVEAWDAVKASPWIYQRPYRLVRSLATTGPYTFRVTLREFDPYFASTFFAPLGEPALPVVRHGPLPVGTGPFRVVRIADEGDVAELTAFDSPLRRAPRSATIRLRNYADAASETVALESGGADIAFNVDEQVLATSRFHIYGAAGDTSIVLANAQGALHDVRLRRAVFSAIDTRTIRRTVYRDDRPFPVENRYDPASARDVLRKLSASNLQLRFAALPGNVERVALLIQQQLRDVGVDMSIRTSDLSGFFAERGPMRRGDFDLTLGSIPGGSDPDIAGTFACSVAAPAGNFARLCDPVFDKLMRDGKTARAAARFRNDAIALPLAQSREYIAWSPRVQGIAPSTFALGALPLQVGSWSVIG